jgi:hypothetical protein
MASMTPLKSNRVYRLNRRPRRFNPLHKLQLFLNRRRAV